MSWQAEIHLRSLWIGLVRTARPRQWIKNVLLLATPAAAGVLGEGRVDQNVLIAVVAFCVASSAGYFFNDACDLKADRLHPVKRYRPIPSGILPIWIAVGLGTALGALGLMLAALVRWQLMSAVGAYLAITLAYTLWLKSIVVADIVLVAMGFVVRAIAGGVATSVPPSRLFLIVTSFGTLFIVTGKRHSEHLELGPGRGSARATLDAYPLQLLRLLWGTAAALTVVAYCLWTFQQASRHGVPTIYQLTIVPFLLFVLRYAFLIELGRGSTPEDIVLRDRSLQVFTLFWAASLASAMYFGH
jgi:decaprenyl-phosphate phosphoribosyltransferase